MPFKNKFIKLTSCGCPLHRRQSPNFQRKYRICSSSISSGQFPRTSSLLRPMLSVHRCTHRRTRLFQTVFKLRMTSFCLICYSLPSLLFKYYVLMRQYTLIAIFKSFFTVILFTLDCLLKSLKRTFY